MEEANKSFSKATFFPHLYFYNGTAQCYGLGGNIIIADLANKLG